MPSPFAGLAENATMIFKIPSGAVTYDEVGNAVQGTTNVTVSVYLKKDERTSTPRLPQLPGVDESAFYCSGFCVDPMILPASVAPQTWAICTWSGINGFFYLDAPINPPHGREGIGAILESVQGTKLTGWFQLKAVSV